MIVYRLGFINMILWLMLVNDLDQKYSILIREKNIKKKSLALTGNKKFRKAFFPPLS